jgi:hypothetical protein
LYDEKDLLLFRLVETWIEGDRKKSRVDYKNVRCWHATRDGLLRFISHFDFESQTELTNAIACLRLSCLATIRSIQKISG